MVFSHKSSLDVLWNDFFSFKTRHINLHESLFFVVQNPFLNAKIDSTCWKLLAHSDYTEIITQNYEFNNFSTDFR